MPTTFRKSALTVAALGALALGGSAIAGAAGKASTSATRAPDTPGARGAVERRRREGQGGGAGEGPRRDRPAHRGRRPVRLGLPRPHQDLRRQAPGRAGELLVPGHRGPGRSGRVAGRKGGPGGRGPGAGETPLTGDTKDKVEAAVLAKYPGATIVRTETNGDSAAPYESHIKTSAGQELEVHVSKDFTVLDAREHPAHP